MPSSSTEPQRQSLRFYKAFFEVHDVAGACALLLEAGAVEMSAPVGDVDANRWYFWQEPPRRGQPAAPFIVRLRGTRLVLEGPGAAAVGRGWRALQTRLAPHATARVAAGDQLDRFLPRKRAHSGDRPETWNAEHESRVLAEFYGAFCQRWADTPHGFLDGRTPRQAAADGKLRSRLETLLDRMQRLEDERRSRNMPSFSAADLRAELE